MDFYEIFSLHSAEGRAFVERVRLTPQGNVCLQPAKVEVALAQIPESMADLLGRTNPCAIPETDLRRERQRCKKCLVFSGAEVIMQVACGERSRRIRMDILDRDMFDPEPRTPQHRSWTMRLLVRLDQALGSNVLEQAIFPVPNSLEAPAQPPSDALVDKLKGGRFDSLFDKAPDQLSELFRQSQIPAPKPTTELISSSPFRPTFFPLPKYPPLTRLTNTPGQVTIEARVNEVGEVLDTRILNGHPLLKIAAEAAVKDWKFPADAAGRSN